MIKIEINENFMFFLKKKCTTFILLLLKAKNYQYS